MSFTMKDVSELKELTGAGMMNCQSALKEANGDKVKAAEILREKGIAGAAKKSGRIAAEGIVESYIHMGGKIGVLVEVNCETDFVARNESFKELVKGIAMHIAASNPLYLDEGQIPADVKKKELEFHRSQMADGKKPENVIEKILDGKMKKYYSDICLVHQGYIREPEKTITQLVTELTAKLGEKIAIRRFV